MLTPQSRSILNIGSRWPIPIRPATSSRRMFSGAQRCFVKPFALSEGGEFRSVVEPGPFKYGLPGYQEQAEELLTISAGLTDKQKMIVEYWSDDPTPSNRLATGCGSHSGSPRATITRWTTTSDAVCDTSIATWDAKRAYDSVRSVTAIPPPLPRKENPGVGRLRHGHHRDGWRTVGRISTSNVSYSALSGICLRPQRIYRGSSQNSGALDRERSLRRFGDAPGQFVTSSRQSLLGSR